MSKLIKYTGAEVVIPIEVKDGAVYRSSDTERYKAGSQLSGTHAYQRANELATAIKRALGRYEPELSEINTRFLSEPVCEHCGAKWTEKGSNYNGGCCDADQCAHESLSGIVLGPDDR